MGGYGALNYSLSLLRRTLGVSDRHQIKGYWEANRGAFCKNRERQARIKIELSCLRQESSVRTERTSGKLKELCGQFRGTNRGVRPHGKANGLPLLV
ncbi:hypothetical protein Tco_0111459 [Tanacetum coccineum]